MSTTTSEMASTTQSGTAVTTENVPSSSVAAVVAGIADASNFNSLFVSTGVAASLSGKGPYTVFVPTNEAYASLTAGTLSNMTSAQKKRLAQYAVVSGKALDIDAVSSGTYTALSKDPLNFQVNLVYKEAFVNSGYAIREYKASNGIVYLISAVLVPPQTPDSTTGSTGTPHP
jgi:uncharacterized surface protein with fasciclin (FAS1) repeats